MLPWNRRRTTLILTFGALLLLYGLHPSVQLWRSSTPRDFYQFWAVGNAVGHFTVGDMYSLEERTRIGAKLLAEAQDSGTPAHRNAAKARKRLEPAGTPFLYAVFALGASGRFEIDYRRFQMVSAIFCLLGLYSLLVAADVPPWLAAASVVVTTRFFFPLQLDITTGNVNQIQLGTLAALIAIGRVQKQPWAARAEGFIFGCAVFFKPNVAIAGFLVAAMEIIDGRRDRWRNQAAGLAASMIAVFAGTGLLFGNQVSWLSWYREFPSMGLRADYISGSFLSMLLGVQAIWVSILLTLAGTGLTVLLMLKTARPMMPFLVGTDCGARLESRHYTEQWLALGVGIGLYILTAPLVHGHYFVLMLPLSTYFLRPNAMGWNGHRWMSPALWMSLGATIVMGIHPLLAQAGFPLGRHDNPLTFTAAAVLTAAAALELHRIRGGPTLE